MVLLGIAVLVVDLLSNQEQDTACAERTRWWARDAVISLHALNEHVMIRHDHNIQTCFNGSLCDIFMGSGPIREAGVHVQVDDNFVHEASINSLAKEILWTCLRKSLRKA